MSIKQEIFLIPPSDFNPTVHVAACYLEFDDKCLYLKRNPDDFEGNRWCMPAGKAEIHETPHEAVIREVFEETGIHLKGHQVTKVGQLYIRRGDVDFIYHMFQSRLSQPVEVVLSDEHQGYTWASLEEAMKLPLMIGEDEALRYYKKFVRHEALPKATVCVHLLPIKDNQVLLSLRENTGFEDGKYGLISGHVEDGESAVSAMIREADEEAGIEIAPSQLEFVHFMHHYSYRVNAHLFYKCLNWDGEFVNNEPEKCGALQFYPLDNLPSNTVEYVADAVKLTIKDRTYSEKGW